MARGTDGAALPFEEEQSMGVRTANVQDGNIGETLESLAATIHGRRESSPEKSYTARLLTDVEHDLL